MGILSSFRKNILHSNHRFVLSRYFLVGLGGVLIHCCITWVLSKAPETERAAYVIGFGVSNLYSFVFNSSYTFGASVRWKFFFKYILVTFVSLAVSSCIYEFLVGVSHFSVSFFVSSFCGILIQYVLHYYFTYK